MFPEYNVFGLCVSIELRRKFAKVTQDMTDCHIVKEPVNDRKYVFHFGPKPKPKPEKHLASGRIPKPKVQTYVKIGGILLKFNVSND